MSQNGILHTDVSSQQHCRQPVTTVGSLLMKTDNPALKKMPSKDRQRKNLHSAGGDGSHQHPIFHLWMCFHSYRHIFPFDSTKTLCNQGRKSSVRYCLLLKDIHIYHVAQPYLKYVKIGLLLLSSFSNASFYVLVILLYCYYSTLLNITFNCRCNQIFPLLSYFISTFYPWLWIMWLALNNPSLSPTVLTEAGDNSVMVAVIGTTSVSFSKASNPLRHRDLGTTGWLLAKFCKLFFSAQTNWHNELQSTSIAAYLEPTSCKSSRVGIDW